MLPAPYLDILRLIATRLNDESVHWVVTGSAGFALQGVPVEIHDIDLQTDEAGAYEIERRFAEDVLRPVQFSAAERIRSHFGALRLNGLTVEIMGDIQKRLPDGTWEAPVPLQQHRRFVSVDGLRVPVLSLEYERSAYLKLGRLDKAQLLETWLERHPDVVS